MNIIIKKMLSLTQNPPSKQWNEIERFLNIVEWVCAFVEMANEDEVVSSTSSSLKNVCLYICVYVRQRDKYRKSVDGLYLIGKCKWNLNTQWKDK